MKRFFRVVRGVFLTLFSIAVLGAGGWLAYHLMTNKPQPERRRPPQSAPLVEVEALQPVREQIIVPVMGTVIPAVDVTLQARVAGEITATHPQLIDGGVVRKGDVLVTIDPRDYQLALVSAEAQLESARYNLKVEEGQQDVAQREWELLDMQEEASELDQELALRKPHLRQRQAALRAAEAQVEQARLDLERTQVKAPFNAVIQEAYVDRGDQAAQQTQLATLIGTDVYWVRVSVKNECLQWIQFPDGHGTAGSAVRVHTRTGAVREGRVL
ncbi:MAG: HlyD family efflux transporter periplasmic adaptor subunit, partial [Candidatus Hydrogenedentes bacterium]|nr:HlyD family efflux transporter periplasmic adaptor subunit [Candidatus Hydrogenedentota bacterium]